MKKVILALSILAASLVTPVSAQPAADPASQIIALERQAMDGWIRGDPAPTLAASDPDITYFHVMTERRVDGRRALEALFEPFRGRGLYDRYEMVDPKVQVAGDAAVLSYILVRYNGAAASRWNATQVYRKTSGEWRVIHSHWSQTAPAGAAAATREGGAR